MHVNEIQCRCCSELKIKGFILLPVLIALLYIYFSFCLFLKRKVGGDPGERVGVMKLGMESNRLITDTLLSRLMSVAIEEWNSIMRSKVTHLHQDKVSFQQPHGGGPQMNLRKR